MNYLQAGISFLVAILLARYLGPDLYGRYTFGIVFNTSLFILIQYGLDKTLVRDLVQKQDPGTYLLSASLIKLVLMGIGLVIVVTWGVLTIDRNADKVAIALLFGLGGCLFGLSPRAWFDYIGKIQLHAWLLLSERVLFLIGVTYLLFVAQPESMVIWTGVILVGVRGLLATFEWSFVFRRLPKVSFKSVNV